MENAHDENALLLKICYMYNVYHFLSMYIKMKCLVSLCSD